MGVGNQGGASAALPPGRKVGTHYLVGWVELRAGVGGCEKSRLPMGFDPQTVQTLASRYTDYITFIYRIYVH